MRRGDALETVDIGVGIVGFFTFAFLVITVAIELTGGAALGYALTLLALVLLLTALIMTRRRIVATRGAARSTPRE